MLIIPLFCRPFFASAIQTGEWPFPVPFAGRLDLTRVGLMGHSFGAATVTLMASKETRVKSVVAHDLWTLPLPEVSAPLRGATVRGFFRVRGDLLLTSPIRLLLPCVTGLLRSLLFLAAFTVLRCS